MLPDLLAEALRRPRGARFRKAALQVNPFEYMARHSKPTRYTTERDYNEAVVAACVENEIDAIAVTDHFRVSGSRKLDEAARAAGVTVFRGFEAVSKEGVHLLCLFDPDRPYKEIERIIGDCGVHDEVADSPVGALDVLEMLEKARSWDAVLVAAHVSSEQGGLFYKLSGQPRVRVWRSPLLEAIAIAGRVDDLEPGLRSIVRCEGDYARVHPPAVLNACDVSEPEALARPGAWCWIKMAQMTIDGLRQAVLDPLSRIRLASDPVPEEHTELVALAWKGGFLDGQKVHLSENLNVLIGGRGAGKSTIVESLRYVLDLEPLGEEARRLHEGIVRNVLQSGTKISLLVCTRQPGESLYVIERTVPNPPVVKDEGGNVLDVQPSEIVRGTEIFGQHEISELTKSEERLTRLLDRFVDRDDSLERRKQSVKRELARTRRQLIDAEQDLVSVGERLDALPGLEDTLKRYRAAGVEDRLREQTELVREEHVLDTAVERVGETRETLEQFERDLTVDVAFVSERALEGLPAKDLLSTLGGGIGVFNDAVASAARNLHSEMKKMERTIAEVRRSWSVREQEVTAAYEKILRELQKERVDGEEFIGLRRSIEELRPLRHRQNLVNSSIEELMQKRRNLLAEWEDLRSKEFYALLVAAKKISRALERRIRVTVRYSGNRAPLAELLRKRVGGRLSEAIQTLTDEPELSVQQLASLAREGGEALAREYTLASGQAERIAGAAPEVLMEVEELDLAPTTQIELNVAAETAPAQWQPLNDLSTGQKATAVLLLLLHESSAPLIIDQPEDDLDNRFISEGVVPRMREEKRRRQFIFSTHNANIPVLGDAELILGLRARGEGGDRGHAEIPDEHAGSIDSEPVRELVEILLEGGREAFEMRRRKYGF
ncbi:MAG: TrlF family AAA-like ATPase [Solirubrobacteraceae bacterium]